MEEDATQQQKLKKALDKAVGLIAGAQSSAGGWIYTPDSNSDEGSVTVTQIQALRACRMAGVVVDKKVIDKAVDYIKKCQNDDGSIRYSLNSGGDGRRRSPPRASRCSTTPASTTTSRSSTRRCIWQEADPGDRRQHRPPLLHAPLLVTGALPARRPGLDRLLQQEGAVAAAAAEEGRQLEGHSASAPCTARPSRS